MPATDTPDIDVRVIEPDRGAPGWLVATARDGIDLAEVTIRYDGRTGTARALYLLARVAIEVVVRARNSKPVQVLHREAEGSRWNG